MLLLPSDLVCIFQNILIKNKASLTKQAFILACSNEDLSMIKILVNVARDRNEFKDSEAPFLQNEKWQEWLFGKENVFCAEILKQERNTELSHYLLKIKMEKSIKTYDKHEKALKKDKCYLENMDSKNTKLIYNLQSTDKHDRRLKVILLLNMTKNIELLIINDKKTKSLLLDTKIDKYDENTNLHLQAKLGHADTISLLLENGIYGTQINELNINKRTPLHLAAEIGHTNVVSVLVQYKQEDKYQAKIDLLDKSHQTPLILAIQGLHLETAELLLQKNAKHYIPVDRHTNKTMLHWAAQRGYSSVVKLLVQYKANIDPLDDSKMTPMFLAIKNGHLEIVHMLLQNNASPHLTDAKLMTAMDLAINFGHFELANLIHENYTLHLQNFQQIDMEQIQLENKTSTYPLVEDGTPLHFAAKHGHKNTVKLLIMHNASISSLDCHNKTPLHYAVQFGHFDLTKYLLKHQAAIDAKDKDKRTPLHYAVDGNHIEVVKLLLENNSDGNSVDILKRTPLHISARYGHFHIAKLLLDHKYDSNALDNYNESPLHCAAYGGHEDIVEILVEFHADRNLRNIHGRTALEVAQSRFNYDVVRILESGMSAGKSDNWSVMKNHFLITKSNKFN